jgi:tetratricopeptide (TPR) repeat protein
MNYSPRLIALLGVSVALVQIQSAQALTKVEVGKVAQSVTVMIQNAQNPQDSGSGIIIKRDGETYTVLTAHHVVQQSPAYKVLTPDKKLYPMIQGLIQPLPGVDLALVQFKSAGSYSVAKMGDSAQSPSGSASFVAGFPGTTAVRSEPEYYFTSGEIAANGSRPNKDGYALAYSNPTLPGMSGGPVLNEQGELIGIHGRAERAERLQNSRFRDDIAILKTEFNYAIPINTFLSLAPQVNKTLDLKPPSPLMSSALKADDFFLKGEEKIKGTDYEGAIADYDQAIQLDPKLAVAYVSRGFVRTLRRDKQGAIADYDQAIQLDPKLAAAYVGRGYIHKTLGDKKEAIADYDQAIQLDPRMASAYVARAHIRSETADLKGSFADMQTAIKLDPSSSSNARNLRGELSDFKRLQMTQSNEHIQLNPTSASAYSSRGDMQFLFGDKRGAIADYDKAIELDPKYFEAYDKRALIRYELGDKQGAVSDFDQAIRFDIKDAFDYNIRGVNRYELGDKQGAISDFNQAIRFNPKVSAFYIHRGIARYELGDKQGAISDFDQAIFLDPKYTIAYRKGGGILLNLREKQVFDFRKAADLFKTQGDERSYQNMLKALQKINGR